MKTELVEKAPFNVVETIVRIAKHLENSKLDNDAMEEIKEPLEQLSTYLNTTNEQSILFAITFALQAKLYSVDIKDVIKFIGVGYIDALNFKNDIDRLLDLGFFEADEDQPRVSKKILHGRSGFSVPTEVSDQIYANLPIKPIEHNNLDIYSFIKTVSEHIQKRKYEIIRTIDLFFVVENLEEKNNHLTSIAQIKSKLSIDDRTLLYEMLNDHISFGAPSTALELTMSDIYENVRERRVKIRQLIDKVNPMFSLEFIELTSGRMANDFNLILTNRAIEYFMQEDASLFVSTQKAKNIILNEAINPKELFYGSELSKEIGFLTDSLMNEKFIELQDRMKTLGLPKGVAAIFYGAPGTGKTESVFQIAKQTGRDIFKVDISQTKSMWFGESEKLIKKVFTDYDKACKQCKLKPILLFNEADAILGKRQENNQSNVGATENAIVNILLEEIERFDGILIATTNLQGNLDPAFERRFLFKVKFETPSKEAKAKIWMYKLPWLEQDFAMNLANDYSFSGGEIDNIVRKATIQEVLTGVRSSEDEIVEFCRNEKHLYGSKSRFKVGFPLPT
ncbi:MAG: AAA family ATPase [Bacteroidales bacterium]|nr:AAA family ATPase [Bacteroidales bacterium]